MKERVIAVLNEIHDDVDYESCEALMDDQILSSLDLMQLIAALDEEFSVEIPAEEISVENFNSVAAIEALVKRLQG
ncbi:MAG: acyl carrier protein [Lachnospiraceae bacterium]|jgi:acyl carrier protein|nr:acyl carrier protein [Lachnospiraceae bacterium]